jgi:cbb3-type cytochrome oxidase subunit 3
MSLTDIMSAAGLSSWTELALILCLFTFAAIVLWVFVVRSKPSYDDMRNLPLEENNASSTRAAVTGGKRP